MLKMTGNIKVALGVGMVAAFYLQEALRLPLGSAGMPDIGFFPILISVFLISSCLGLIIWDALAVRKDDEEAKEWNYKKPTILAAAIVGYLLFLETGGFLIATVGLLFVCFLVMEYRNWYLSLGTALAVAVVANLIFTQWLGVYFPKGLLN